MRRAFTLVELLIVIAIIAILAAIAIPQFSKYKQRAYVAAMKSDAHNIIASEEAYFSQFDKYATGDDSLITYDSANGKLELKDSDGNVVATIPLSKNVVMLKVTATDSDSDGNKEDITVDNSTEADNSTAVVKLTCPDGVPGYGFALGHKNIKVNNKYSVYVRYSSCVDKAPKEVE